MDIQGKMFIAEEKQFKGFETRDQKKANMADVQQMLERGIRKKSERQKRTILYGLYTNEKPEQSGV